jgi:hypothetical protein
MVLMGRDGASDAGDSASQTGWPAIDLIIHQDARLKDGSRRIHPHSPRWTGQGGRCDPPPGHLCVRLSARASTQYGPLTAWLRLQSHGAPTAVPRPTLSEVGVNVPAGYVSAAPRAPPAVPSRPWPRAGTPRARQQELAGPRRPIAGRRARNVNGRRWSCAVAEVWPAAFCAILLAGPGGHARGLWRPPRLGRLPGSLSRPGHFGFLVVTPTEPSTGDHQLDPADDPGSWRASRELRTTRRPPRPTFNRVRRPRTLTVGPGRPNGFAGSAYIGSAKGRRAVALAGYRARRCPIRTVRHHGRARADHSRPPLDRNGL